MTDPRRGLPSVDRLLRDPAIAALVAGAPRNVVAAAVRETIEDARRAGVQPASWPDAVAAMVRRRLTPSLRPVLNATGVVLHTNLGRAPLADAAVRAVTAVARDYSTLEYDLASGSRGSRSEHCASLLAELCGAEASLVVNNAAAALVLALNALSAGREVILSRGELIEIGGSFRIPDIMARSGAVLREVGTTNRTHLSDYAEALGEATGAILMVHRSNFEQRGFVSGPSARELAALAQQHRLPFIYDVGSGLLADLAPWGLTTEPRVPEAVATGADLVIFSGDKLLGGPQAGCLAGSRQAVTTCGTNPLARASRADKMTLAALEATLRLYQDPATARREVPVLRMLTMGADELRASAEALAARLPGWCGAEVAPGESAVGGGSFPGASLPTFVVVVHPGELGADSLARRLRLGDPAVIARVADDRLLLDPRTLPPGAEQQVAEALDRAGAA